MSTILLSVKPQYAHKLIDGTKKFEYRKRLPQLNVSKILVYSSYPEKKIIGEIEIIGTISMKKSPLWEQTKCQAGISREEFRTYFKGCSLAHAYIVGNVRRYKTPLDLSSFNIGHAPQSFVYIND